MAACLLTTLPLAIIVLGAADHKRACMVKICSLRIMMHLESAVAEHEEPQSNGVFHCWSGKLKQEVWAAANL